MVSISFVIAPVVSAGTLKCFQMALLVWKLGLMIWSNSLAVDIFESLHWQKVS